MADDVADIALDRLRGNAVRGVVLDLFFAAATGFVHRALHAAGDPVGIEDDAAIDVARGTTDRLNQRSFGAQKPFFVGVEDRNQPAFGNIEPFTQQVDPDQHVIDAEPQVADQLDPFERFDVRVHIADLESGLVHIFRSNPRPCVWSAW